MWEISVIASQNTSVNCRCDNLSGNTCNSGYLTSCSSRPSTRTKADLAYCKPLNTMPIHAALGLNRSRMDRSVVKETGGRCAPGSIIITKQEIRPTSSKTFAIDRLQGYGVS